MRNPGNSIAPEGRVVTLLSNELILRVAGILRLRPPARQKFDPQMTGVKNQVGAAKHHGNGNPITHRINSR